LQLPFLPSFSESSAGFSTTLQGRTEFVQRVATTRVYETAAYVIADIGDVRLALASPASLSDLLQSSLATTSTVIDSNMPPDQDGMGSGGGTGSGRGSFSGYREKGVTTCILDGLTSSIRKGELHLSGATVPLGQGRKVAFLKQDGSVQSVIDAEPASTR
jgi:hypothetical protein